MPTELQRLTHREIDTLWEITDKHEQLRRENKLSVPDFHKGVEDEVQQLQPILDHKIVHSVINQLDRQIVGKGKQTFGSYVAFAMWLNTKLPALQGKTPTDVILENESEGTRVVLDCLNRLLSY